MPISLLQSMRTQLRVGAADGVESGGMEGRV